MSNYHVLEMSHKKNEVIVVFHIAVPNENNAVGINLRSAIKQWSWKKIDISCVPWLAEGDPDEYLAIQNGAIYEHNKIVEFDASLTTLQKRSLIDDMYTSLANSIPNIIRNRFSFWGLDRDV